MLSIDDVSGSDPNQVCRNDRVSLFRLFPVAGANQVTAQRLHHSVCISAIAEAMASPCGGTSLIVVWPIWNFRRLSDVGGSEFKGHWN